MDVQLWASKETADYLRVHRETMLRWAKSGKLPARRLAGGRLRFRSDDVEALLEPVRGR